MNESREEIIQGLVNIMWQSPIEVSYEVKKHPKGVHVVIDVTKEQMDEVLRHTKPAE